VGAVDQDCFWTDRSSDLRHEKRCMANYPVTGWTMGHGPLVVFLLPEPKHNATDFTR
jgi:hypothetical protein